MISGGRYNVCHRLHIVDCKLKAVISIEVMERIGDRVDEERCTFARAIVEKTDN